jgi:hypothetical protein
VAFLKWLQRMLPARPRRSRFVPVSEDDALLLPHQVEFAKNHAHSTTTDFMALQDSSDPILPEDQHFVANLLMEFHEDQQLAMIHGLGRGACLDLFLGKNSGVGSTTGIEPTFTSGGTTTCTSESRAPPRPASKQREV